MQCVGAIWRNRIPIGFQARRRQFGTLKMTMTDDNSTIVVLHPEEKVPYEKTSPLPKRPEPIDDGSPLRAKPEAARRIFFSPVSKSQNRDQLAKLTQTTVHRWFPRSRDKRAKDTPMDRPYL